VLREFTDLENKIKMIHMYKNKSESALIGDISKKQILESGKDTSVNNNIMEDIYTPLKRRKFLGLGMFGFAGIAIPSLSSFTENIGANLRKSPLIKMFTGIEKSYWDRTDKFEVKKELLKTAWEKKDFHQVRALANSIRISSNQARIDNDIPGISVSPASDFKKVSELPIEWKNFAKGWNYYKIISVTEQNNFNRNLEPVELLLSFPADKVKFLTRELRLAKLQNGKLTEVVSQVQNEIRRGESLYCQLMFLAECKANDKQVYFVFFGNPDAEIPNYVSDLETKGEGYKLDIENNFFKVKLSRQHGKIERLTIKRNHGLVLYPGGVGHGEPGNIDWSNDYMSDGGFQKYRIALWDECPDYEVIHGPVCTIIRSWGFPYSPLHPVFSPSRLNIDVEYRFYSGLPYFNKYCRMLATKDFQVGAIRDDEWVFPGKILPEILWIDEDGKLHIGPVEKNQEENLWGVGYFNKDTSDSFIALYLEHKAEGIPILHTGVPRTETTPFHGQVWARYPYRNGPMKEGSTIYSKNAYVTIPFDSDNGPAKIEKLRDQLKVPLTIKSETLNKSIKSVQSDQPLARKGESGDSPISKALLWQALGNCKDPQLYHSDISIVELGLVYDIQVLGDSVNVVLAMPHRGRPLGTYFTHGSSSLQQGPEATGRTSLSIPDALLKVPGVKKVTMKQTWNPEWTSNFITEQGRKKLELLPLSSEIL
jgi:metal-sulfur cluster biosynthetic enzyme